MGTLDFVFNRLKPVAPSAAESKAREILPDLQYKRRPFPPEPFYSSPIVSGALYRYKPIPLDEPAGPMSSAFQDAHPEAAVTLSGIRARMAFTVFFTLACTTLVTRYVTRKTTAKSVIPDVFGSILLAGVPSCYLGFTLTQRHWTTHGPVLDTWWKWHLSEAPKSKSSGSPKVAH